MTNSLYSRLATALSGHTLPAAFVDLQAFDANLAAATKRVGGKPVRVASKSVRCEALIRRALNSGPGFQGVMCFSAAEAVWLHDQGLDDLLVAYPTMDKEAIQALCKKIAQGAKVILTVDSVEHLSFLATFAKTAGVALPLSIEMDMSLRLPGLNFGVWRSPIRTPEALVDLATRINDNPHLNLAAVMGYEAQLSGVPDASTGAFFKNRLIRLLKTLSMHQAQKRRTAMLDALDNTSLLPPIVNAGGTGCLSFSASGEKVTEVTCGSGLYNPWLFDDYVGFDITPAAAYAIPVVRKPAADKVTCLGGGYTASGSEGALPQAWLPEGIQLSPLEGAGEVQTPILGKNAANLKLGDPVLMRHAKAGELCERFNTLLLIEGDRVVNEVPTYRGAGHCFL